MWELIKSIVLGAVLSFVVSLFVGSSGSSGGMLNVRHITIQEVSFYWSWFLLVIGTALSFGIMSLMR